MRRGVAWSGFAGLALVLAACDVELPEFGKSNQAEPPAETGPDLGHAASLALTCTGCHGEPGSAMISLGGRDADALAEALNVYRTDTQGTSVMHRLMRGYSEADIDAISQYFAHAEATP